MEKTAIVTGASRGIGAAAALALAAQGCRVAVCCRTRRDSAESVAARIRAAGGTAAVFCADVSDEAAVRTMFAQVEQTLGPADILVNNAGVAQQKLFTDITAAEWDAMFGVCVKGAFHCCQAALPHMIRQKWGRIINISSVSGVMGNAGQANYCASKAGVIGLTKSVARELGSRGITVNAIAPGFIDTEMTAVLPEDVKKAMGDQIPMKKFGKTEDVANLAAFLASDQAGYITGQVINVDGGMAM